jgi:hypothetical protein
MSVSLTSLQLFHLTYLQPVIAYTLAFEGPTSLASSHAAPFLALNPLSTTISTNVTYIDLYRVTANGLESQACVANKNQLGAGTSLSAWNLAGVRKAFAIFANLTADTRFNASIILLENYGMYGVRAVDPKSTSLPTEERERPVLASPSIWWDGNDEHTARDAGVYAREIRDALATGVEKRHCYVNYANGEEGKREMYGYDGRVERLTGLKGNWDPERRFGFYNPVV